MTNKLALWIISAFGGLITTLLGWVVVMLLGINTNQIEQKFIDQDQTEKGFILENNINRLVTVIDRVDSMSIYRDKNLNRRADQYTDLARTTNIKMDCILKYSKDAKKDYENIIKYFVPIAVGYNKPPKLILDTIENYTLNN